MAKYKVEMHVPATVVVEVEATDEAGAMYIAELAVNAVAESPTTVFPDEQYMEGVDAPDMEVFLAHEPTTVSVEELLPKPKGSEPLKA